jgi:hypothetical protein
VTSDSRGQRGYSGRGKSGGQTFEFKTEFEQKLSTLSLAILAKFHLALAFDLEAGAAGRLSIY